MNEDQISAQLLEQRGEISALWENTKSAHRRIDQNDGITKGIHILASNIEGLATQVKLLTERVDASVGRMERSIKSQGERIGAVELSCRETKRFEKSLQSLTEKVEAIEREPAARWRSLVKQVIALLIAILVGSVVAGVVSNSVGSYYYY
ncbi:MAG: hypothetical protein FWE32_01955 [Oscillospiraceae bacterium]|nr:hypothetical protein [Oscillospiraceae bacterium]